MLFHSYEYSQLPPLICSSFTSLLISHEQVHVLRRGSESMSRFRGGPVLSHFFHLLSSLLPQSVDPPCDALSSFLAPSLPFPSLPFSSLCFLLLSLLMNLSVSDFRGRGRTVRQLLHSSPSSRQSVRLSRVPSSVRPSVRPFVHPQFPKRQGNLPRPPIPLLLMFLSSSSKAESLIHKFEKNFTYFF